MALLRARNKETRKEVSKTNISTKNGHTIYRMRGLTERLFQSNCQGCLQEYCLHFISKIITILEGLMPWIFRGRGSKGHTNTLKSKGNLASHISRSIQQQNIYRHPSFTNHAATTKIPHLLCEKTYLKPRVDWMILFTNYLYTKMCEVGGRKTPIKNKKRLKNEEKFLVWVPSICFFYGVAADWFPVSGNTKNKSDLP